MTLNQFEITENHTLFLDRDGVINHRLVDDYVKSWKEFEFLDGVPEAIRIFSGIFKRVIIVSNQQGIGKGLMTEKDLDEIHHRMLEEINRAGGRIDKIYFCPALKETNPSCRKPQIGMGLKAKKDFPEIEFKKSVMAGDSLGDMQFGKRLNMTTVLINPKNIIAKENPDLVNFWFLSLNDFAKALNTKNPTHTA